MPHGIWARRRPNIIFIMADDLGNADLGYRGGEIKTPHIDKLAQEGVRCESFYGQPVCTPSRAALMTGRYPMRHGLQTLVIFPSHTYGLPTDERTLPQALHDAGYRTLMVGKWHLGHADKKFWPQNRGFDHFYGNVCRRGGLLHTDRGGVIDWQRDGEFLKEDGYYTTLIGDEAVKLIEQHDTSNPLFLYVASLAPHAPYQAPREAVDAYQEYDGEAADICSHDYRSRHQVGRSSGAGAEGYARQHSHHLQRATMAVQPVHYSQLGHVPGRACGKRRRRLGEKPPASNGKLRGGKGSLHEGGVRVPTIFNWPARLQPRSSTSHCTWSM